MRGARSRSRPYCGFRVFELNKLTLVGTTYDFLAGLVELGTTSNGAEYEASNHAGRRR